MATNRSSTILAGTLIATALAALAALSPPPDRAAARPARQIRPSPTIPNQPTATATPWSMPGLGVAGLPGCASSGGMRAPKDSVEDGEAITLTVDLRITCPAELARRTVVIFVGTRTTMQLAALRSALANTIDLLAQAGVGRVAVVRAEDEGDSVRFHGGDDALRALRAELAILPAAGPVPAERWVARMQAVDIALSIDPALRPMLILFDGTEGDAAPDELWPIVNRTLLDLKDHGDGPAVVLDLSSSKWLRGKVRGTPGFGSTVLSVGARSGHAGDLPVYTWRALTSIGGPITGWQVTAGMDVDLQPREPGRPMVWRGRALSTTVDIQLAVPVVARYQTGRALFSASILFSRLGPLGEAGFGGNPGVVCVHPTGRPEACAPPTELVPPTRTATATPNGTPTGSPTPRNTRRPQPTPFPDWVYVEPVQCAVAGEHAVRGDNEPQGEVLSDTLTVRITCPQLLLERHAAIVVGALEAGLVANARAGLQQLGNVLADADETAIALRSVGDPASTAFTVPHDLAAFESAIAALAGRPPDTAATWQATLDAATADALAVPPGRRPLLALLDGGAPTDDPAAAITALERAIARVRTAGGIVLLADVSPDAWLRASAEAAGIDSASLVYVRPWGQYASNLSTDIARWAASVNAPLVAWEAATHFPTLLDVDDRLVDPPPLGSNALGATWVGMADGHALTLRLFAGGRTLAPVVDTAFLTTLRLSRGRVSSYEERFWSDPVCAHPAADPLWCAQAQGSLRRVFLPWSLRMP